MPPYTLDRDALGHKVEDPVTFWVLPRSYGAGSALPEHMRGGGMLRAGLRRDHWAAVDMMYRYLAVSYWHMLPDYYIESLACKLIADIGQVEEKRCHMHCERELKALRGHMAVLRTVRHYKVIYVGPRDIFTNFWLAPREIADRTTRVEPVMHPEVQGCFPEAEHPARVNLVDPDFDNGREALPLMHTLEKWDDLVYCGAYGDYQWAINTSRARTEAEQSALRTSSVAFFEYQRDYWFESGKRKPADEYDLEMLVAPDHDRDDFEEGSRRWHAVLLNEVMRRMGFASSWERHHFTPRGQEWYLSVVRRLFPEV